MQTNTLSTQAPKEMRSLTKNSIRYALLASIIAIGAALTPLAAPPAEAATGDVDYFCSSSWGTTVWNGRDPFACSGTLTGYRDGYNVGSVNMVQLIADQPPRTEIDLNQWCTNNSFYCTMAAGAFWAFVSGVWGAATS
ncbi:hypothetical protein [Paenarthrobacter nitroguajacolicus]|uniref:hypothetical protein n=1 Tax=Paenarthrobacter nitroguajacolicus TaxID=211146 RepID=UPI00343A003A